MKHDIKYTIIVAFFIALTTPKLYAQFERTIGFGTHIGYETETATLGIGGHLHYYHTNNLRFAPSYTYFFKKKDSHAWSIDADAHYIFPVSITASLYPIAGLHYSNWNLDPEVYKEEHRQRLGANLGLGFQHDIAYRVRASFELKYQLVKDYSQVYLTAGFGFWF